MGDEGVSRTEVTTTAQFLARKKTGQSPLSELLVPLCRGPGHDKRRLQYAQETLKLVEDQIPQHHCGLTRDARNNTPAFYACAAQRTPLLYCLLDYEKKCNW